MTARENIKRKIHKARELQKMMEKEWKEKCPEESKGGEKKGEKRVNQKQTAKKLIMQHKMQKFMDFMKLAGALT